MPLPSSAGKQQLKLEKNKSNLFLIKSYSFNDKTNIKRPEKKLKEFQKYHSLMLDKSVTPNKATKDDDYQINKNEQKAMDKKEVFEKMGTSKSTLDTTENVHEFQALLRNPLEDDETPAALNGKRPQSMPAAQNNRRTVIKSKTLDDIQAPRLKRDSFIRHSFQSIRRSFSSSKKQQSNNNVSTSNSSTSTSSSSSAASDTLRKSKAKDYRKDTSNSKAVEESNYLIAKEEQEPDGDRHSRSLNRPCNIVITFNDTQTPEEHQHKHEPNSLECTTFKTTPPSLYTMDSLSVLKEEDEKDLNSCVNSVNSGSGNNNTSNPPCAITEQRSTSSVSTLAQLQPSPLAQLQTHAEYQSDNCLNILDPDYKSSSSANSIAGTASSSPPQKAKKAFQHQLSIPESLQSTSIGCATSSEYTSARSLTHSDTSLTPVPTLNSSGSFRSISPSRRSASSNSSSTAKHDQTTAAATAAAAATATTSNGSSTTTPPEKEKKIKEISSSRVKKFHRHFSQVSKDEKLINYFSCALVSDILLQGHLYITDKHFAFYSNVFGYVTKVVIPTSSVTRISKEKTAKIIPNAVGVATADERHVFGSFISREAAFRLMCSVCPPLGVPEILPKDPANIEICEEYSIEDDSSCSISGNESPAQITELQNTNANGKLLHTDTSQTLLRRSVGSSNLSLADSTADKMRHSDIPTSAKIAATAASSRSSAPTAISAHYVNGASGGNINLLGLKSVLQPATSTTHESEAKLTLIAGCASTTTSATSTPTPSTSSSPTTVMTVPTSKVKRVMNIFESVSNKLMSRLKFPTEIHVVYIGVMLTLFLALFSVFLLYRLLDLEAKANSYRSPLEFNLQSGNDEEIFKEALRLQRQLQLKTTQEAENILKMNLEQIAKVRRSLETLSMLIHDRSSSFASTNTDDND